jgi:DNA replication ATP-dependent helicase Dna2
MMMSGFMCSANSLKRSPWQRSRSNPVQTPKPRAPVSEVTKDKLNKFQYHPKPDDEETKESVPQVQETPATHLTWRDLLGPTGTEDENNTSPNDRLLWDSRPDNLYLSALSPMMSRKGRKRARSSSPVSSPAPEKTPSVNVKKLAQALKSPHADPTLELWDRYSLNAENASGLTNPTLAQLMVSSSPRPKPNEANLRRAISCGLNWPKRRRVERSTSGSLNSEKEMEAKSSLVTALLDTVTSSINGNDQSPSPKKRRICATSTGSPRPKAPASDYGDDDFDDFDDDTIMQLEASINATQLDHKEEPELPPQLLETEKDEPEAENPADTPDTPDKLDEFDDLDDDIFDDAEDLLTSVEQAQTLTPVDPDPDDEFGDPFGGDFDFEAVELAATQAVNCPDVRRRT